MCASITAQMPSDGTVSLDASGTFTFKKGNTRDWQAVLPDGSLATCNKDSKLEVWRLDGSKLDGAVTAGAPASAVELSAWLFTAADGTRINLPVQLDCTAARHEADAVEHAQTAAGASPKPADATAAGEIAEPVVQAADAEAAQNVTAVDTDTGARVTVRADLSQRIEYTTGDAIEMRPDGSRTFIYANGEWLLEAPGLPPVRGSADGITCLLQPGATLQWRRDGGVLTLQQDDGVCAVACGHHVCCGALVLNLQLQS